MLLFAAAFFSTPHEADHALYEQGVSSTARRGWRSTHEIRTSGNDELFKIAHIADSALGFVREQRTSRKGGSLIKLEIRRADGDEVINIIQTPLSPRAYVIAIAGPPWSEKT